jgi:hypothetical protein
MSTGSVRLESRGALALLTIGAPPLNRIDAQVIARVLLAERRASIGTADEVLVSEIGSIFATADAKAGIEAYLRGDPAGVSFVGA